MAPTPAQDRHRQWIQRLMHVSPGSALLFALIATLLAGLAAWQGPFSPLALLAGIVGGLLSFRHARIYYQGGSEQHWLISVLFACLGWPFLQIIEGYHLDRLSQGALTLQYFMAVAVSLWLGVYFRNRPTTK